jgi:flavin-dependent dehydrogenase
VPISTFDVVVYGGTPGGVLAAVAAARGGASVVLLEQTRHVGGMSTSGLVTAELEHMQPQSFSGLALEFYRRVGAAYGKQEPLFHWESRVAEQVFADMLAEASVTVRLEKLLAGIEMLDGRIRQIRLTDGSAFEGSCRCRAGREELPRGCFVYGILHRPCSICC